MIIGIVGTSRLDSEESKNARIEIRRILQLLKYFTQHLRVVTGDADGIDKIVREEAVNLNVDMIIEYAKVKSWDGVDGFKERNIRIAILADYVISITTKFWDEECYHCNANHQRTGGCYTLKHCRSLKKMGDVIVI